MPNPHVPLDGVERACVGTAAYRGVTYTSGPRSRGTVGMIPTDLGAQVVRAIKDLAAVLNHVGSRLEPCAG